MKDLQKRRQTASYMDEAGEKSMKPPPWKKTTTGRVVVVTVVEGVKRRNQRWRVESTVMSEVVTP